MKLMIGKIYKVSYLTKRGNPDFIIGEYQGIDIDDMGVPCIVCEQENHRMGHLFNHWYSENQYESFHIGTSCIKKCKIEEATKEEMLKF